ncbi:MULTISPECIES: metal-dependent hydrolase family protein [unclassified Nocardioides]|uniref:metal-dependent hydrolase family protein n=1 Tax=unclassified Nocardioides TaxID=2615069 RepID=UPI003621BEAF
MTDRTRLVLRGGRVFDGTGAEPFPADVAVEAGRVVAIAAALEIDDRDDVVDVAGCTLLPGMFDCHVHVLGIEPRLLDRLNEPFSYQFYNAAANLRRLLECGITSARDCAGADLGVKQAVADGVIPGPHLQISITALSQTGGHMDGMTPSTNWVVPYYVPHPGRPDSIADGVTNVRRAVRQSLRAGADFIKVLATHSGSARSEKTRFNLAELQAIGEEAAAQGVPVATHAYGSGPVKDALRTGSRSIEHVADLDDEAIELFLETGAWLVPTLSLYRPHLDGSGPAEHRDRIGHQVDARVDPRAKAETAFASFRRAHEAGVRIAMGTDFGNRAGENLSELSAMVLGGMSPEQALVAATSSAAALMGVADERGTLAVGKAADLVVVSGGLADLDTVAGRIRRVYRDGELVHEVAGIAAAR